MQQNNTGDGEKIGIWSGMSSFAATTVKIYVENVNGHFHYDFLQTELKHPTARLPKRAKMIPTRPHPIAYVEHSEGENRQIESECTQLNSKKS